MLSDLPIRPLTKALKWLAWLIGAASFLLISSIVSFNYVESESRAAQLAAFKRIESDTIPGELAKKAATIASLIATPKKYHNQCVLVKGFLRLEFEGNNIYWRQKDYQARNYKHAFWVDFTDSLLQTKRVADYNKHYVVIEGVFKDGPGGHGSLNPGTVKGITSINALQKDIR